jgi:hypothetical protein
MVSPVVIVIDGVSSAPQRLGAVLIGSQLSDKDVITSVSLKALFVLPQGANSMDS